MLSIKSAFSLGGTRCIFAGPAVLFGSISRLFGYWHLSEITHRLLLSSTQPYGINLLVISIVGRPVIGVESCCHRIVESLPGRYAGEITHLYMEAIHSYDENTQGPCELIDGAWKIMERIFRLSKLCKFFTLHVGIETLTLLLRLT